MKPVSFASHTAETTTSKVIFARCRDLSIRYQSDTVCQNINIDIVQRGITVLIGASGAGKSSVLNALTGMHHYIPGNQISGSIEFPDYPGDKAPTPDQLGIIFQTPSPFPFSILKNFQIPLNEAGVRDKDEIHQRMCDALHQSGLWNEVKHKLKKNALHLSGGQQQRLCIARALALSPRALFLDEACSALDAISSRKIEELVIEFSQQQTVFLVTHDIGQARRIADQLYVMGIENGCGTILEHGEATQLFSQPSHPQTRALVSH